MEIPYHFLCWIFHTRNKVTIFWKIIPPIIVLVVHVSDEISSHIKTIPIPMYAQPPIRNTVYVINIIPCTNSFSIDWIDPTIPSDIVFSCDAYDVKKILPYTSIFVFRLISSSRFSVNGCNCHRSQIFRTFVCVSLSLAQINEEQLIIPSNILPCLVDIIFEVLQSRIGIFSQVNTVEWCSTSYHRAISCWYW